jgi:hypothetical protein
VKLQIVFVAFVVGLVGFALPASAQRGHGGGGAGGGYGPLGVASTGTDTAGNKFATYLYGVITKLNKDAMVLTKTKAGVDQTFKFNKKTKFIRDGKDSSLKSLKLGDEVWVDVDEDKKTGDLIARKVITGVFLMPSY